MNRLRMTPAASSLLRNLLGRAPNERNRIVLSDWTSIDWQSLTFNGERHRAGFVISGSDAMALAMSWTEGLEDAEFDLGANGFVAEIALAAPPSLRDDGSVLVQIEALTLAD